MGNERQIIVKYMGGLGNQMFQYAIGEAFRNKGYRMKADVSWYKQEDTNREFLLPKVFSKISIEYIDNKVVQEYENKYRDRMYLYKLYQHFFINGKSIYYERKPNIYDKKIWKLRDALIVGYWQSYKYFEDIREKLYSDFVFPETRDQISGCRENRMQGENIASLHIRGGDYRTFENKKAFGNGCSKEYYLEAIKIIKKKNPKVEIWGFTNDIEYAKEMVDLKEVKWHSKEEYSDWMDMYLMSLCRYNILANSSFSWWAAYLNRNSEKLVIAPKEWYNLVHKDDICPGEWIRL